MSNTVFFSVLYDHVVVVVLQWKPGRTVVINFFFFSETLSGFIGDLKTARGVGDDFLLFFLYVSPPLPPVTNSYGNNNNYPSTRMYTDGRMSRTGVPPDHSRKKTVLDKQRARRTARTARTYFLVQMCRASCESDRNGLIHLYRYRNDTYAYVCTYIYIYVCIGICIGVHNNSNNNNIIIINRAPDRSTD